MIQCGLDASWRLSKSLLAPVYLRVPTGKSCLYLSGPDNARDGKTFRRRGRGALLLETINAPSNRAWKITSERKNREEKQTRR